MLQPGRNYNAGGYRYGFNGQEKTKELGENFYEATYWEYDSRIGRRWNIDPIGKEWESPYACLSNNPIARVDPNGDSDTASAFKAGLYQGMMSVSAERMGQLEKAIKGTQDAIKQMKKYLNQQVIVDVFMSFNYFYWGSQMGSDAVVGSTVDYMASELAARIADLQNLVQQYNSAYTDYSRAAQSLKLELQGSSHFEMESGLVLDRLDATKHAGTAMTAMHLNTDRAVGDYVIYEIVVDGHTFKYGIADANRIRKTGDFAGYPERLAQQLSKIKKYAPELDVMAEIHTLLRVTKAQMKIFETDIILVHAAQLGIPLGNVSHIKKYAEEFGVGELSARALTALRKFLKF